MRQTYLDAHGREGSGRCLRPLDEADRVLEVRLEIAPLGRRKTLKAIEIEVGDIRPARIAVADREGRARHRALDPERPARAAHESRLPGAELARDGDDVAEAELPREAGGDGLGLVGGRGFDQKRPS
jgi:hypothetical protein